VSDVFASSSPSKNGILKPDSTTSGQDTMRVPTADSPAQTTLPFSKGTNPQTWNLYATRKQSLNRVDKNGLTGFQIGDDMAPDLSGTRART